jgi:hypothetical protein
MNLLERAALDTGLKIAKPSITEHFFPLPFDKYIILQADARFESRKYEYWPEVLSLIVPELSKNNIQVVSVGAPGEQSVSDTYNLVGQTTLNQLAYLIKNAKLVVGPDSFCCHLAGTYDVPLVGLYPNMYHEQSQPYFGDKEKQIFLEPDRKDLKPSYSAVEQPKTINWIKPEVIAESILKLLNLTRIEFDKTLYIGQYYVKKLIENVPDQVVALDGLGVDSIIERMDFLHNEDNLAEQLKIGKASIITKRPINFDLIKALKGNIVEVIYEIDEEHDISFVDCLQKNGVNYILFTYKSKEWLDPIKLNYFDYKMINLKTPITKESIPEVKEINSDELIFKSNKFTLSKGKIYLSKAHWLIDRPTTHFQKNMDRVIDSGEFWNESESFYFLKGSGNNELNSTNNVKQFKLEDIVL